MTQQRSGVSGLSGFSQSMSQTMDFSQDMHSAMRGKNSPKTFSVLISRNFSLPGSSVQDGLLSQDSTYQGDRNPNATDGGFLSQLWSEKSWHKICWDLMSPSKSLGHGFKTHQNCCGQKSGIDLQNNNDLTRKIKQNREKRKTGKNNLQPIQQKMSPKWWKMILKINKMGYREICLSVT